MERFFCVELLLGANKLRRLKESFVVVIGIGAVGSYCVEALARSGIGKIRLVDFDKLKPTNFNRHLLALESSLGKSKVEAARGRIAEINPACKVEALEVFAAEETMDAILDGRPNLVMDCVDSVNPKSQILEACWRKKIPVISSMGAALRSDIFSIKTGDISKTSGCPLAREVRSKLRTKGIQKGIFCIYSDTPVSREPANASGVLNEEDDYCRGRARRKLGSLPTVTGVFGLAAAHYAIRHLIGGTWGSA